MSNPEAKASWPTECGCRFFQLIAPRLPFPVATHTTEKLPTSRMPRYFCDQRREGHYPSSPLFSHTQRKIWNYYYPKDGKQ